MAVVLLAACSPSQPDWRRWARWGETDAEIAARSDGVIPLSQPAAPSHLGLEPPQRLSRARVEQDGVSFDGRFLFDLTTRRLHTVTLWLSGDQACAQLREATLRRHGPPDWIARSPSAMSGGMHVWEDQPGRPGFRLNDRPWPNRPHDCILIYRPAETQ